MIPKTKSKGKSAMGHLRVYMGVPVKYGDVKRSQFDDALVTRPPSMYTTLAELSKNLGWHD